jgi:hypothetical protein
MVVTAIDKNQTGAPEHKGIGCTHKCVGRQNHLVAGLYIQQYGCHFERIGATGSEQTFAKAVSPLQVFLTEPSVFAPT